MGKNPRSTIHGQNPQTTIDDLPYEMIEKILFQLPAKEIAGCRSVCKPWDSIMRNPTFQRKLKEKLEIEKAMEKARLCEIVSQVISTLHMKGRFREFIPENDLIRSILNGTSLITIMLSAANETFERLAVSGFVANLMVYLLRVLNLDQVSASNINNLWNGLTHLAPLVGAFISDGYVGRFWTIAFSSFASLLGTVVVTLNS
ncbi:hypothetical protein L6164_036972 [Bauhinia variegata]|uniref:Uncharacterized protein n=1 Tax=Bauhinia variegata TaxID=167791 RepID=A0ACB9KIU5_BAUVA|nr:hypothetical protein L6164_036972 [Bauhinia variegata]